MDTLRGIAVLLVVLQHAVTVPVHEGLITASWAEWFNDLLLPYRMPMLLFLSGMLLHRSLSKPLLSGYLVGKVRRILWPLVLWSLIVLSIDNPGESILENPTAYAGPRHLWFLYVLMFCYLIGILVRWIPAWALVILLYLGAMFLPLEAAPFTYIPRLSTVLWAGLYFFAGTALARWVDVLQRRVPWPFIVMTGGLALAWGALGSSGWRQGSGWEFIPPMVGILSLVWLGPRLPVWGWLTWVGRNTMPIYAVHATVQIGLSIILAQLDIALHPSALTLSMYVIGIVAGLLFSAPWLRWMFVMPWPRSANRARHIPSAEHRL